MSGSFGVACPSCEKVLKIKNRKLIGKRIVCPKCEYAFRIEADKVKKVASKSSSQPSSPASASQTPNPKRKSRQSAPEPVAQTTNPDDEWLSALGEVEDSGSTLDESEFAGSLPPVKRGHGAPKPKKKKRELQESVPGDSYYQSSPGGGGFAGLGLLGGAIGGVIAGVIGALVWGGVTYGSGYEFSILAWGIGALVGFGVLIGAREEAGLLSGIMALVLANLSIFGGKVFAVYIMLNMLFSGFADLSNEEFVASDDYMISIFAEEIVDAKYEAGEEIVYPRDNIQTFDFSVDYPAKVWQQATTRWEGMPQAERDSLISEYEAEQGGNDSYYIAIVASDIVSENYESYDEYDWPESDWSADYPADIWEQAEKRWVALTTEQQEALREEEESGVAGLGTAALTGSVISATWSTLGPLDGLWVLLASFTAFRIGANEHED
ncbi:MAG: hypothetical protein HUJ26_23145 [Planctomycetaceae bacterium]|nr:hypothetical protein [Planctomycetaceae bacterium]